MNSMPINPVCGKVHRKKWRQLWPKLKLQAKVLPI